MLDEKDLQAIAQRIHESERRTMQGVSALSIR